MDGTRARTRSRCEAPRLHSGHSVCAASGKFGCVSEAIDHKGNSPIGLQLLGNGTTPRRMYTLIVFEILVKHCLLLMDLSDSELTKKYCYN